VVEQCGTTGMTGVIAVAPPAHVWFRVVSPSANFQRPFRAISRNRATRKIWVMTMP
jgi:hypothetical protein